MLRGFEPYWEDCSNRKGTTATKCAPVEILPWTGGLLPKIPARLVYTPPATEWSPAKGQEVGVVQWVFTSGSNCEMVIDDSRCPDSQWYKVASPAGCWCLAVRIGCCHIAHPSWWKGETFCICLSVSIIKWEELLSDRQGSIGIDLWCTEIPYIPLW